MNQTEEETAAGDQPPFTNEPIQNHWQLIRGMIVFQFKLAMDGIRDLLLSPISIIVGIHGLIFISDNPARNFNRLLKLGRQSDAWINLFESHDHKENGISAGSSDAYIKKLESIVLTEYEKGGLVKNLKDGTDGILERLRKEASRKNTQHQNTTENTSNNGNHGDISDGQNRNDPKI